MDKNSREVRIEDFILHKKKILNKEECTSIIASIDNLTTHKWVSYDMSSIEEEADPQYNSYNNYTLPSGKQVNDYVINVVSEYVNAYSNNLLKINAISQGKIHVYNVGNNLDEHIDHIHDLFDGTNKGIPVLSFIINLNNEYTGGDFVFSFPGQDKKIAYKMDIGDCILFPSNFIFKHSVSPIISGTRYSLIKWLW